MRGRTERGRGRREGIEEKEGKGKEGRKGKGGGKERGRKGRKGGKQVWREGGEGREGKRLSSRKERRINRREKGMKKERQKKSLGTYLSTQL